MQRPWGGTVRRAEQREGQRDWSRVSKRERVQGEGTERAVGPRLYGWGLVKQGEGLALTGIEQGAMEGSEQRGVNCCKWGTDGRAG